MVGNRCFSPICARTLLLLLSIATHLFFGWVDLARSEDRIINIASGATHQFFINFERQGAVTTLRLIINGTGPVELLDERMTVFADQEHVPFKKVRHTAKQVIFEAANVPAKAFVAARLDGYYRSGPGSAEPGSYRVSISDLDLDGDTDHTGFIEHSLKEDELEDRDGEDGVIILPNWADVDPPGTKGHGIPDCLIENHFAQAAFQDRKDRFDNRINGAKDREEHMQLLTLRKLPNLPTNWRVELRVSQRDAEKIRIFDEEDRAVIIPREAAVFIPDKTGRSNHEHEVKNIRGPAGQYLQYHIEGITPGERLHIELAAFEGSQERAKDVVKARVAPFILMPNERPVRQAFVADFRAVPQKFRLVVLPGLTVEEDAVRAATARLARTTTAPPTVSFWQDPFLVGYAQAPGPGTLRSMILLARLPRGAGNFLDPKARPSIPRTTRLESVYDHWLWPNRPSELFASPPGNAHPALLGAGLGVFEVSSLPVEDAVPVNYGGNVQVTWPLTEKGADYGRIVVGKEMSSTYRDFLSRQEVQAPLIELELRWLLMKHVDEVLYFLSGRQVAMPSPVVGEKLLVDFYRANPDPSKAVFLKGPEILNGKLTGVRAGRRGLILSAAGADLRSVNPDMYLHIFSGKGRYQTYRILAADDNTVTVSQEEAKMFSFWRNEPIEMPSVGSEFIVVARPLHNSSARVLLISLSELLDREEIDTAGRMRTDNRKIREFWSQNAIADQDIKSKILPEIQKLSPVKIIELPVLFHELADPDFGVGMTAFTPNLVNGHLIGKTFLMPKPFVFSAGVGHDLFEDAATQILNGFDAQFVDDYFMFHNFLGEIHCGPNLIREPPSGHPFWWEKKQNLPH